MEDIPLHVIHLSQDDPQKCTSRKMARHGLTELHHDIRHTPRRGILLNPLSGRILGPDDAGEFSRGGCLVGLDCSWKQLDDSVQFLKNKTRLIGRTLPIVLAANPISWGKPGRLSNVEAFATSLFVLGHFKQARQVLRPFKFGEQFFTLNKEPLEAYSGAETNQQLADLQWEFFDKPEDSTND